MPHALGNYARLAPMQMNRPFFFHFEVFAQEHIDGTFEEIQKLILVGMHFPLVPFSRYVHSEAAHLSTLELHRENLNRGNRT